MAGTVTLAEAVQELVHDGDTVALEGFTHLIPNAAGHELIRQGLRDLTLVRMTPDVIYDQLIGMGAARKLVFSWGGNPGVGSLHRLRDAVEHGWPAPLELEEHSHAGMAAAYAAGAANLPFGVLRGYAGSDLVAHTRVATIVCRSGRELAAVPAHQRRHVRIIRAAAEETRAALGSPACRRGGALLLARSSPSRRWTGSSRVPAASSFPHG
jgi:glutaconate CoA-transferase subunit A